MTALSCLAAVAGLPGLLSYFPAVASSILQQFWLNTVRPITAGAYVFFRENSTENDYSL
jgi:hypothetical protein